VLACLAITVSGLTRKSWARELQQVPNTLWQMDSAFLKPASQFDSTAPSPCTAAFAGCSGTFVTLQHSVAGNVIVIDDCTLRISAWQYDGQVSSACGAADTPGTLSLRPPW
jgi:hypothetical protein